MKSGWRAPPRPPPSYVYTLLKRLGDRVEDLRRQVRRRVRLMTAGRSILGPIPSKKAARHARMLIALAGVLRYTAGE